MLLTLYIFSVIIFTSIFITQIFLPIWNNRSIFPIFRKSVKNLVTEHKTIEDQIYEQELKIFNEKLKEKLEKHNGEINE
jgi:hypothetical protein